MRGRSSQDVKAVAALGERLMMRGRSGQWTQEVSEHTQEVKPVAALGKHLTVWGENAAGGDMRSSQLGWMKAVGSVCV